MTSTKAHPHEEGSLSPRERKAWISLSSSVAVYVPYFVYVGRLAGNERLTLSNVLGATGAAVIVQTVLGIVLCATLSSGESALPKDERDLAIEARAFRWGYLALAAACLALIVAAPMTGEPAPNRWSAFPWTPLVVMQAFFLCFCVGEVTRFATVV